MYGSLFIGIVVFVMIVAVWIATLRWVLRLDEIVGLLKRIAKNTGPEALK